MISLGKQALTIEGVQVYADHADPNQFWYLPGPVQLARRSSDDRPDLTMITYRKSGEGEALGGGFLNFTADCHLGEDRRSAVLSRLQQEAPDEPLLAAVPFESGTVKCVALGEQSTPEGEGSGESSGGGGGNGTGAVPEEGFQAVQSVLGASHPSLQGRNEAVFSLSLSKEGAQIAEETLKEGGTAMGVIYDLEFSAMRPALKAEVHADLDQVYQRLGGSLEGSVYFVDAGIDAAFEKMRQEGLIEVKVQDFSDAEDRSEKANWALNLFKNQLMEDWFSPTLTGGPTGGAEPAEGETIGSGTSGGQGSGDGGSGSSDGSGGGTSGSSGGGDASGGSGGSASDTAEDAAETVEATTEAAEDASGKPRVSLELNFVRKELRKEVTVRYHRSEAVQRSYNPQGNLGLLAEDLEDPGSHFVNVDLDEGFFRTLDVSVQSPIDMERIGLLSAQAMIQFGDPESPGEFRQEDFIFEKEAQDPKTFSTFLNEDGDFSYEYTVEYHFDSGSDWAARSTTYELPERTKEDRTLLLDPSHDLGFLDVEVLPNEIDAGVVKSTDVHLRYEGAGGWSTEEMLVVKPDSDPRHWKVRTEETDPGGYEYRLVHHLDDGTERETEWTSRQLEKLPVNDPFDASLSITFLPAIDREALSMAFVEVRYEDPANDYEREERVDLLAGEGPGPVELRLAQMDGEHDTFSYRTLFVTTDNQVEEGEWIETNESTIPIQRGG